MVGLLVVIVASATTTTTTHLYDGVDHPTSHKL